MKDEFVMKKITPYTQLRKKHGWAQVDVAAEVGISKKTLSDYETGHREPPKRVVVLLDNFYKCNGELIKYWLKDIDFSQIKKIRMFGGTIRILRKYVFDKL